MKLLILFFTIASIVCQAQVNVNGKAYRTINSDSTHGEENGTEYRNAAGNYRYKENGTWYYRASKAYVAGNFWPLRGTGTGLANTTINYATGGFTLGLSASTMSLSSTGSFIINTNSVERIEIENDGAIQFGGSTGASGQIFTSNGNSSPPTWQTIPYLTGTGSANRIAYWTGTSTQSFGPHWNNTDQLLGIGGAAPAARELYITSLSNNANIQLDAVSGSNPTIEFTDGNDLTLDQFWQVYKNNSDNALRLYTGFNRFAFFPSGRLLGASFQSTDDITSPYSIDAAFTINRSLPTGAVNGYGYDDHTNFYKANQSYVSFNADVGLGDGTNINLNHYDGFKDNMNFGSTGTMAAAYSFLSAKSSTTAGTITSVYGLYAADTPGPATITNNYGVFVEPLTEGTNNYAIYTDGATPSKFEGEVETGGINISSGTLKIAGSSGSSGQVMTSNGASAPSWQTVVAGSNTQVQYNNSGAFGAESAFTYNPGTNVLTVDQIVGGTSLYLGPTASSVTGVYTNNFLNIGNPNDVVHNISTIVASGGASNVELQLNDKGNGGITISATGSGNVRVTNASTGTGGVIIGSEEPASGTGDITLNSNGSEGRYLVLVGLPTASPCASAPSGTIWSNAGILTICP